MQLQATPASPLAASRMLALLLLLLLLSLPLPAGSPESPEPPPAIKLLPLALDDWDNGHELPDVVSGRIFGDRIFVRVENRGAERLRGVHLRVESGPLLELTVGEGVDLQPGQRSSLHAVLRQPDGATPIPAEACPLSVRLVVLVGSVVVAQKQHRLLCRQIDDRFSFVYLDADGSPQLAAAKFPAVSPRTNRTGCPKRGCAVLLSTHGMDVTAQRQADCYRPKQGLWVLAPHGRGTHGFNWQGPGHWSALRALEALSDRAAVWPDAFVAVAPAPRRRLIFTGHSNGGFGAWMFGTHYPDAALGVAPLAGMATMGTTESVQRPPGIADKLWKVIDSTVEEYRGDSLAPNLVGIPFMARAGAMDRVIDPRSTRRMASLLQAAGIAWQEKKSQQGSKLVASGEGIDATVVELAGKEHWWWDTYETNDGGALDDKQLRAFFKRALSSGKSVTPGSLIRFSCANLAGCGSRAGVRILQQQRPGIERSHLTITRPPATGAGDRLQLHTENVERLSVDTRTVQAGGNADQPITLGIDDDLFSEPFLGSNVVFCRDLPQNGSDPSSGSGWHQCKHDPTCGIMAESESAPAEPRCCRQPLRSADVSAGPIRRVLAAPFVCVYGTAHPSIAVSARYRAAAIAFANAWSAVGGGVTSVVPDTDFDLGAGGRGVLDGRNIVLWGGADTNILAGALALEQPIVQLQLEKDAVQKASQNSRRIGGGFAVGGCTYTAEGTGLVSLGPVVRDNGTDGRLVVTLAGTTLGGFDKAVELFTSRLFDTNSWQHRLPEFVVAGPNFLAAQAGRVGGREDNLHGVVAAGYFDSGWGISTEASYVAC